MTLEKVSNNNEKILTKKPKELTFSQDTEMRQQDVPIVCWSKLHKIFPRQATELPSVHIKSPYIDLFQAKLFYGPLDPLSNVFLSPTHWV